MSFNKELDDTIKGFVDPVLAELTKEEKAIFLSNAFIAGGCLTSVIQDKKINDCDIFFKNPVALKIIASKLIRKTADKEIKDSDFIIRPDEQVPELYSVSIPDFKLKPAADTATGSTIVYKTSNALSLKNRVQIVTRFVGPPDQVFKTFDFAHCKLSYEFVNQGNLAGKMVITPEAQDAINKKELHYSERSRFVLSAFLRAFKFQSRGWKITPQCLVSLSMDMGRINWKNKEIAKRELNGVYGLLGFNTEEILALCSKKGQVDTKKLIEELKEL